MSSTTTSRRRALLAGVLLAVGLSAIGAVRADALTDTARWQNSDNAAAWLVAAHRKDTTGASSPGTYADIVLGLAASEGDRPEAVAALGHLKALAPSWVKPTATRVDAAAAAKAILAARALQEDIHRFSGLDLEALLRSTQQIGPDAGRFGAVTPFGQSLALLALTGTGEGVPAPAAGWLVGRQCPDGGFADTTSCAATEADHTALAAQALHAVGRPTEAAKAGDWLEAHQAADGGFGTGSNANSTALATEALRALGRTAAALKGAARVASLQKTSGSDAGAIAFRSDADGDLLFATTQGVLAFGAPRLDLVRFPDVIGEPCAPGVGVTEVVDLALFDGTIHVGCSTATAPTGVEALQTAGFTVGLHPAFTAVCTINGEPDPAVEGCFQSGKGFWSYAHATRGDAWQGYDVGPGDSHPAPGSIEGWRYDPAFNPDLSLYPRAATDWPSVSLTGPGSAATGMPAEFRANVTIGGAAVGDGTVQLFSDGAPLGAPASVGADGVAVLPASFADRGTSTVTARYLGSAVHNPRSAANAVPVTIVIGPGYILAAGDGGVFALGGVRFRGSEGGVPLVKPIVGAAMTPSGAGYWLVASDGGIFAHGDAGFFGSMGGRLLNKPIVGMVPTPSGLGYWLVATDGGIFAFGDAAFFGSTGSLRLVSPVVGIVATPSGRGYVLAAGDGGVFAFGDAVFAGSMGGTRLVRPVVAIVAEPGQPGYILVAGDGGVFAFGGAVFRGSTGGMPLVKPIVAASAVPGGYRFAAGDGGVFSFGVPFRGSVATIPLVKPIVAFASH
jgi:hypothetical protein